MIRDVVKGLKLNYIQRIAVHLECCQALVSSFENENYSWKWMKIQFKKQHYDSLSAAEGGIIEAFRIG